MCNFEFSSRLLLKIPKHIYRTSIRMVSARCRARMQHCPPSGWCCQNGGQKRFGSIVSLGCWWFELFSPFL